MKKFLRYFYLVGCIGCIILLIVICIVMPIPNNFAGNAKRILTAFLGLILYFYYNKECNKDDSIKLKDLKKKYQEFSEAVTDLANNIAYNSKRSKDLALFIDSNDDYLISFDRNLTLITSYYVRKGQELPKDKILVSACLLDALSSKPFIIVSMYNEPQFKEKVFNLNMRLAISAVLWLLRVRFEDDSFYNHYIELLQNFTESYGSGSVKTIKAKIDFLEFMEKVAKQN